MPPFNGSGTFTPYTPGNPVVTGTVISSTAFNATQSDIAAGLTNAVTRDGQSPPSANLPMGGNKFTGLGPGAVSGDSLRWEQLFSQGAEQDIASAATTDIGAQNTTVLRITGTTTITSLGTNYNGPRFVRFAGVLTLTHNATTLILPSGANITTAAGDSAIFVPKGAPSDGWECVVYQRASGRALIEVLTDYLNTTRIDVASAATVNLTSSAPNTRNINITGTTTITAFTVAIGQTYFVRFNAALTLTNNANIVTQTGANITTAAGDTCIIRATAANVIEVLSYVGAATTAQPGRVELATDAEAQAGTDATRAVTPDNLGATVIGIGQTTQSVANSLNTTYTNSTGRPIMVVVTAIGNSSADTYIQFLVNGNQLARASVSYQESGTWRFINNCISWIVPAGATYRVDVVGGTATMVLWNELRV